MSGKVTTGINNSVPAGSKSWGAPLNKPSLTVSNRNTLSFADGLKETESVANDFVQRTIRDYHESVQDDVLIFQRIILNNVHSSAENWPLTKALPLTPIDQLNVQWRKWIFNPQRLHPVPERGIAEQMGSTTQLRSDSLARFGISFTQEIQFAGTEEGGKELLAYLTMISASINETFGYDAIQELKNSDALRRQNAPQGPMNYQTMRQAAEAEISTYGQMVKNPRGIEDLADLVYNNMKNRGVVPNMLILAGGAKHSLAFRPAIQDYSQSGKAAEQALEKGSDMYPRIRNMEVVESRQYIAGQDTQDPMVSESTVGEYAVLRDYQGMEAGEDSAFQTSHLSSSLYDEEADSEFMVDIRTAFDTSLRFDEQGNLNATHDRLCAFLNGQDLEAFSHNLDLQNAYRTLADQNRGDVCFDPFITRGNHLARYMVTELFGQCHEQALNARRLRRISGTASAALRRLVPDCETRMTKTRRVLNELALRPLDITALLSDVTKAFAKLQRSQPDIEGNQFGGLDLSQSNGGCVSYPMLKTLSFSSLPEASACREACLFIEEFVDAAIQIFPTAEFLNVDKSSPNFTVKSAYTSFVENCLVGYKPALWLRMSVARGFTEAATADPAYATTISEFPALSEQFVKFIGASEKVKIEQYFSEIVQQINNLNVPVAYIRQIIDLGKKVVASGVVDNANRFLNVMRELTHHLHYRVYLESVKSWDGKSPLPAFTAGSLDKTMFDASTKEAWVRLPLVATPAVVASLRAQGAVAAGDVLVSMSDPASALQGSPVVDIATLPTSTESSGLLRTAYARAVFKASAAAVADVYKGGASAMPDDFAADSSLFGKSRFAPVARQSGLLISGETADDSISEEKLHERLGLYFNKCFVDNYQSIGRTLGGDAVQAAAAYLFISSRITREAYHAMFNHNVAPYGEALLNRAKITHLMGSMIAMVSGTETGATFIHKTDVRSGYNPANGTALVQVSLWAKPIVMTEENIEHVPNVSFHGYLGGCGPQFITSDKQGGMDVEDEASIYSCWVVLPDSVTDHMLPLTGLYPESVTKRVRRVSRQLAYIGAMFYALTHGWSRNASQYDQEGFSVSSGRAISNVSCQGFQRRFNPATRGFDLVIRNKGHLGITYAGVKDVRTGRSSTITPNPYGSVTIQ